MAQRKKSPLRIIVPLLVLAGGALIAFAVLKNTGAGRTAEQAESARAPADVRESAGSPVDDEDAALRQPQDAPEESVAADAGRGEVAPDRAADASGEHATQADAATDDPGEGGVQPAPAGPRLFAEDLGGQGAFTPIGGPNHKLLLRFSQVGTGILSLELTEHFKTPKRDEPYIVQGILTKHDDPRLGLVPFAATSIVINGETVGLGSRTVWNETAPGEFEAFITDGENRVGRVVRRFELRPDGYDLQLIQRFENLSDRPMRVSWRQLGPVDLPPDEGAYGGDRRRLRFGYLLPARVDPSRSLVQGKKFLISHDSLASPLLDTVKTVWPNDTARSSEFELVWFAMTNRYFGVVVHPAVGANATSPGTFELVEDLQRVWVQVEPTDGKVSAKHAGVALQIETKEQEVAPGDSADLSMGVYAGPKARTYLESEPQGELLGLGKLVVFSFGGPCAFCTFQPLAYLLRAFLGFLDSVLGDWALAIIILVLCVRTILHPVTKFSQVRMQRFGKQMQGLAPKQKKIQEKYKDDPKKMREEMQRLMREEGVNFAGALGCLPMFLQTPVWIALYAMIFYTWELRHEPAFYGVFQRLTGGDWLFMSDLSAPDSLIAFGGGPTIPLMGTIDSFNILPILLGFVFYVHQKYLTPPPTTAMTPEQESAQKMSKVMMVVLFPVIMYNAPSALALYFVTNSTIAIFESRIIRRHVNEQIEREEREGPKRRGPGGRAGKPGEGGFLAKLSARIEAKQKEMERMRQQGQRRAGGGGGGGRPGSGRGSKRRG